MRCVPCKTGGDLLYFLHVVPERRFEVIGGDAAETIINEDESAEKQVVASSLSKFFTCLLLAQALLIHVCTAHSPFGVHRRVSIRRWMCHSATECIPISIFSAGTQHLTKTFHLELEPCTVAFCHFMHSSLCSRSQTCHVFMRAECTIHAGGRCKGLHQKQNLAAGRSKTGTKQGWC